MYALKATMTGSNMGMNLEKNFVEALRALVLCVHACVRVHQYLFVCLFGGLVV